MYFTFAFWCKPLKNKRFDHLTYENIMLYHAMSNAFLKHLGQKTCLMADKEGAELLNFIDYDKVVILEELDRDDLNFLFSAMPKFYALQHMSLEDVLIDYDLFIYKPKTLELLANKDCDMIYSFYEGSDMPNCSKQSTDGHNRCLEKLRKYQDKIEYNIPPNSLNVSYPNTSLMKFNNQEFKDIIISNYFKHYELLKNEDFSNCTWPDVYIEQYFLGLEAKKNNYNIIPVVPEYDTDKDKANHSALEIGFCHLGAQKNNTKNMNLNFFYNYDLERFSAYLNAYNKLVNVK